MKKLLYILFLLGCLSFLAWSGARLYAAIQFGFHCEAFLRHAADANTIDIARKELQSAINYCEAKNLTSGSTSLIFPTDDEDIGLWYTGLKSSQAALDMLPANASRIEKHTALGKLRKTLVDDNNKDNTTLRYPNGIAIYPYNRQYILWCILSLILLVFSRLKLDKHWYP